MVRAKDGFEPLLNRPLSWFRYFPSLMAVEFIYQVIGKGTGILSKRKPGEELIIIGPLGRGFEIKDLSGKICWWRAGWNGWSRCSDHGGPTYGDSNPSWLFVFP
jgi:NAD(P)H-flavin reductase